jgi:RNA polymerase sigma-70 factor (ECF subfamily)
MTDLERRLHEIVDELRRKWTGIAAPPEAFVEEIDERLREEEDPLAALAGLPAEELFLAWACARGDRQAIRALDDRYLSAVGQWVAGVDSSPEFADEVRQRLSARLLVGETPKIADFTGSGPLAAWLRVAALRTALNLVRESKARRNAESAGGGLYLVQRFAEPELELIRERHRPELERAVRAGLAQLSASERHLLRLRYLDDLGLQKIGRLHRVDRTTAARWVERAREHLLAEIRRELNQSLQLTPASLDSLIAALRSQLELDVARLLESD